MNCEKEQIEKEVINMYDNGLNANQISKNINKSFYTVKSILVKHRNPSFKKYNNGNMQYFDIINSDAKAYLLGFIAADGCITKSRNSIGLTITIHKKDKIVLDKLKEELCSENPIKELKRDNLVRFVLYNKELTESLAKVGIYERKSLSMDNIIKNIPEEYRSSFIRGYFDGDGSFTYQEKYNRGYVQIRGTKELLIGIVDSLNIESYSISEYDSIPNLSIGSKKQIKKFFDSIYKNSSIHLDRKYNKMEYFVKTLCQDQTISSS